MKRIVMKWLFTGLLVSMILCNAIVPVLATTAEQEQTESAATAEPEQTESATTAEQEQTVPATTVEQEQTVPAATADETEENTDDENTDLTPENDPESTEDPSETISESSIVPEPYIDQTEVAQTKTLRSDPMRANGENISVSEMYVYSTTSTYSYESGVEIPIRAAFSLSDDSASLTGAVYEIRVPKDLIELNGSSPKITATTISNGTLITPIAAEGDDFVIKYSLNTLSGGMFVDANFRLTTKLGYIADGTRLPITLRILDSNGEEIASHTDTQFQIEAIEACVRKNVRTYLRYEDNSTVNYRYAREDTSNPGYFAANETATIEYCFTLYDYSKPMGRRYYDKVTISDKIPDGAVFVSSDNPGWTYDDATRTATYVAGTTGTPTMTDGYVSSNNLSSGSGPRLKLRYPGAAIGSRHTNTATLTLHQIDQSNTESDEVHTARSTVVLYGKNIGGKINIGKLGGSYYDVQEHRDQDLPYRINIYESLTDLTYDEGWFQDVVIRDDNLDARLKYKYIKFENQNWNHLIWDVYAEYADGARRLVAQSVSVGETVYFEDTDEMVAFSVESTGGYAQPDNANGYAYLTVYTELRDKTESVGETVMNNSVTINAHVYAYEGSEDLGESTYRSTGQIRFRPYDPQIAVVKVSSNSVYVQGERFTESIRIFGRNFATGLTKLENLKIVDLLPVGAEYTGERVSFQNPGWNNGRTMSITPEVVTNYKNTGQTALIFDFAAAGYETLLSSSYSEGNTYEIFSRDRTKKYSTPYLSLYFYIPLKVNYLADEGENKNINTVYMTMDNMDEFGSFFGDEDGWSYTAYPQQNNLTSTGFVEDDAFDIDNDGITSERVMKAEAPFRYEAPRELILTKQIKGSLNTYYVAEGTTEAGGTAEYRLTVFNNADPNFGGRPVTTLTLLDLLPALGDRNVSRDFVTGEREARNSTYGVMLNGPISPGEGYDVYYTEDPPGEDMAAFTTDANWTATMTDYTKAKAFKIVMRSGQELAPGESRTFQVSVKAPEAGPAEDMIFRSSDRAINTYGVSVGSTNEYAESNSVALRVLSYHVSGTVFKDLDDPPNGTFENTDDFYKDRTVELVDATTGEAVMQPDGVTPYSAVTDEAGYYEMDVHAPGTYKIRVVRPNSRLNKTTFADTSKGSHLESLDETSGEGLTSAFTLNASNPTAVRNAGFFSTGPEPVSVQISGDKTLSGGGKSNADIIAGAYQFRVARKDTNGKTVTGVPTGDVSVQAGGTISFGTWEFEEEGIYRFEISEVIPSPSPAGFTYDAQPVTVEITVDTGTSDDLVISGTSYAKNGSPVTGIAFANTYTPPTPVNASFGGTKTLKENGNDKTFTTGQFKVNITADAGNDTSGYEGFTPGEKDIAANGSFSSGNISFKKPGTYQFKVKEVNGGAAGYTYDTTEYTAIVTVTLDAGTNTLATAVSYKKGSANVNAIAFANTYTKPDSISIPLSGTKTLTENGVAKSFGDGDFRFELTQKGSDPAGLSAVIPASQVSAAADGSVDFGNLGFSKEGSYTFEIRELGAAPRGYVYDDKRVQVTVKIKLDPADNTLKQDGAILYKKQNDSGNYVDATGIVFANTYTTPDPARLSFGGTKLLRENGNIISVPAGKFKVNITEDAANDKTGYTGFVSGEKAVDANGAYESGTITFTKAGEYTFYIKEADGGATGYTYDDTEYRVVVSVVLNTTFNTLSAASTVYKGEETASPFINNTYTTPDPITLDLFAEKTLKEGETGKSFPAGKFNFTLVKTSGPDVTGLPSGAVAVPASDAGGYARANFDPITISSVGTYVFTISENNDGAAGYTYDDKPVTVTVTVTLDETTNTLQKTISYRKNGQTVSAPAFSNTYETPQPDKVRFSGHKTLKEGTSNKPILENQFEVSIAAASGNDTSGYTGFTAGAKPVGTDGNFSFDEITFTKAGTYRFDITEVNKGAAGYEYDSKTVTAEVKVILNEETNKLEAATKYYEGTTEKDSVAFNNKYTTPDPITVPIKLGKKLTEQKAGAADKPKTFAADQFKFLVTPKSTDPAGLTTGNVPTETVGAPASDAGGKAEIDFGSWEFSKEGTYVFEITEDGTAPAGFTNDPKSVTVTVAVRLDSSDNKLKYTLTYEKDGSEVAAPSFDNFYTTPDPVKVSLEAIKTLKENGRDKAFSGDRFGFELVRTDNLSAEVAGISAEPVFAASDGKIAFEDLTFNATGVYTFEISESGTAPAGYTYDAETAKVEVTIRLNEDTNTLEPEISYQKGDHVVTVPKFENQYETPEPIAVPINGTKTMTGHRETEEIGEGEFEFTLTGGNLQGDGISAMTDAGGAIRFGDLTFEEAGEYIFTIREETGEAPGITYDNEPVTVFIVVTLNEETNELEAAVTYNKNGEAIEGITFENDYTPKPVTVDPPVKKIIKGDPPTTESFTFVMKAVSNTAGYAVKDMPMPEGSSNGEKKKTVKGAGEYEFGEFALTRAGTYVYAVTEEKGNAKGFTYDDSRYTITWVVTDTDGVLSAKRTIVNQDGEENTTCPFTNVYKESKKDELKEGGSGGGGSNGSGSGDHSGTTPTPVPQKTIAAPFAGPETAISHTGDERHMLLWGVLFFAAILAEIGLRRKMEKR